MSIASNLQAIATSLSGVLSAINTKLTAKGSTAAETLSDVPDKINAIPTGTVPTETKNITENGTYDVINYASAVVAVPEPTGTKSITENGTYDVSEYASAVVDVDVDDPPSGDVAINTNGTHNVANFATATVNVPTGTARTGSDLTASGKTVTVPAGLYSQQYTKDVSTAQQATPTISINTSTGVVNASSTQSAGYVSAGTKSATYSLSTQSAQTITPGTSDQTIASGKYLTGAQTIKGDADLVPGNIKSGVNIFGVSGSYSGATNILCKNGSSYRVNVSRTSTKMLVISGLSVDSGETLVGVELITRDSESTTNGYIDYLVVLFGSNNTAEGYMTGKGFNQYSFFILDNILEFTKVGTSGGQLYIDDPYWNFVENYYAYPIVAK